jgi:hypothetical protein
MPGLHEIEDPLAPHFLGFGEERHRLIIYAELAFRHSKAHRCRGEALAQGMQSVVELRSIRRPPSLGDDLAMPDEHEAVHLMFAMLGRIQGRQDARRKDPLGFARAAGKLAAL